ncbi:MAG: monovalent cation/H(+) antiporter subunit G [Lachnospiraceae bacterium]|nr:monovalent cation/H(+) antiporter subunit G [Lachnospiraceae bacterium]
MIAWLQLIISIPFLLIGLWTLCCSVLGVFRFKYVLNRMHAAAMGDSLGILFILIGLMILSGFSFGTLKLALIVLFFWVAGPVSSHMIANMEVTVNEELEKECEVPEDGTV